jgi:probable HAF family extracellular repeat protein
LRGNYFLYPVAGYTDERFLLGWVALGLFVAVPRQADADYVFTNLDSNDPFPPLFPTAINNLGQIVGYDQSGQSFLLSGDKYVRIAVPGALLTQAFDINDSGEVVGHYLSGRMDRGFVYRGGSSYVDFPLPCYGVNNSGDIVGGGSRAPLGNGFLLSGGTITTFAVPGATVTQPYKINDSNQIVGSYENRFGSPTGFLLSAGNFTTIAVPRFGDNEAYGINNAGQIVGGYLVGTRAAHGFLFSDGRYTTFEPPGATYSLALGINDAGQIVGSYVDAAGVDHGYLATPIAEPATLLLAAIATPIFVGVTWRRSCRRRANP